MKKRIFTVTNKTELERCYPIIKELRPQLRYENYLSIYEASHKANAYEIVAIEENNQILAVMGYRFLIDFVRGKHLYIDDLVTTEKNRSQGLGAELLKYS